MRFPSSMTPSTSNIGTRIWFESLKQDVGLSLRQMRRSPLFFTATIATLALGIGANGAVFSILQSVLLQPLPYDDPSQLTVLQQPSRGNALGTSMVMTLRDAGTKQLGEIAAAEVMHVGGQINTVQGDQLTSALDLTLADRTVRLSGATATPNFFRVLGVRAAIGRVFSDADERAPETPVVLSDATWRREFDGDPNIVGRAVTIASGMPRVTQTLTVIGVLPRGVHFTYPDEVQAWLVMPWTAVEQHNPYSSPFTVVARLRRGLSTTNARQLIASLPYHRSSLANAPSTPERILVTPMRDWIVGETRPSLYLLGSVAALLLVVTCLTVSNALLARISERQQELAVRSALGAERSRLLQQLLVEGALLSICGTVAGIALAIFVQPIVRALLPASLPQVGDLGMNTSIVAFGAVMACVTTLLAAVAPAWGGTKRDAAASLTRAAAGATATRFTVRWRHALIGAQASLTTMLLIFSALLLTSLWRLGQVPLGFQASNVVAIDLQLLNSEYRAPDAMSQLQHDVVTRARAIPGITSAGLTSATPFRGFDSRAKISVPNSSDQVMVQVRYVDSAYFSVLRVPIIRGRSIGNADRTGSEPVVLVSESFARRAFGAKNPIGSVLDLDVPTTVVGVVGDVRYAGLEKEAQPAVYVAALQHPRPLFTLVARIGPSTTTGVAIARIRAELHAIDPTLPALRVAMVDQIVDATVQSRRFYSVASGAFALLALTLTTVGLALVVARAVAERRRELAIRAALGATMFKLAHAAVGQAMIAVSAGVLAGLLFAGLGGELIAQFLFQVGARSPITYAAAASFVLFAAVAAASLPLKRFNQSALTPLLRAD